MRCFTTCPMANFALRIGGWMIADRATWFSRSMAEVLLRTGQQATHSTSEFTDSLQEHKNTRKFACWMYRQEHCHNCGTRTCVLRRLTRAAGAWTLRPKGYWGNLPLADGLKVRFWGVRGLISCSGAEYTRYGGNTSCLEVTAGGRRLIFDAGTGIRPLGLDLARQAPLDIDI